MNTLLVLLWALAASLYVLGFAIGVRREGFRVLPLGLIIAGFALLVALGVYGAGAHPPAPGGVGSGMTPVWERPGG
jgi:hypothetical protein